jgi:hypothetical protein
MARRSRPTPRRRPNRSRERYPWLTPVARALSLLGDAPDVRADGLCDAVAAIGWCGAAAGFALGPRCAYLITSSSDAVRRSRRRTVD